jgi:hypothetical protein
VIRAATVNGDGKSDGKSDGKVNTTINTITFATPSSSPQGLQAKYPTPARKLPPSPPLLSNPI